MPIRDANTVYFCVDLEASGPVPGLFNLVSIAGVTVRLVGNRHERGDAFYHELKPICEGFVPEAEAIYKLGDLREDHLARLTGRLWSAAGSPDRGISR